MIVNATTLLTNQDITSETAVATIVPARDGIYYLRVYLAALHVAKTGAKYTFKVYSSMAKGDYEIMPLIYADVEIQTDADVSFQWVCPDPVFYFALFDTAGIKVTVIETVTGGTPSTAASIKLLYVDPFASGYQDVGGVDYPKMDVSSVGGATPVLLTDELSSVSYSSTTVLGRILKALGMRY